jgi:hypothetical protein
MVRKGFPAPYDWRLLAEFNLDGDRGAKELSADGAAAVAACVQPLHVPEVRLKRIQTAVKEAAHNLLRREGAGQPSFPLKIRVLVPDGNEASVSDSSERRISPATPPGRGWGFFLVEKMAGSPLLTGSLDKFNNLPPAGEGTCHTVELFLYLEG